MMTKTEVLRPVAGREPGRGLLIAEVLYGGSGGCRRAVLFGDRLGKGGHRSGSESARLTHVRNYTGCDSSPPPSSRSPSFLPRETPRSSIMAATTSNLQVPLPPPAHPPPRKGGRPGAGERPRPGGHWRRAAPPGAAGGRVRLPAPLAGSPEAVGVFLTEIRHLAHHHHHHLPELESEPSRAVRCTRPT